jgi:5'-3' exoribonuclease 1
MNGIIHAVTHGNDNLKLKPLDQTVKGIFRHVDRLVTEVIRPKQLLMIAVDGVAPRAKLNQQRSRRFRSAKDSELLYESKLSKGEIKKDDEHIEMFDTNSITPGTELMNDISVCLQWYIRKRIKEHPIWKKLKVVYSGMEVPGEGEHKIMSYIRDMRNKPNYEPNLRHCFNGQDADLYVNILIYIYLFILFIIICFIYYYSSFIIFYLFII